MNFPNWMWKQQVTTAWVLCAAAGSSLAMASEPPAPAPQVATDSKPTPPLPFEARVARETDFFRNGKPKPEEEMMRVPAGLVVSVLKLGASTTWKKETGSVAQVKPDAQSQYYALSTHLRPLEAGEVISDAVAGKLLFSSVPAAQRAWCARFTRRVQLPPAAMPNGGKGAIVYSAAVDDACTGYLALVSGTDKDARVRARVRRGPLSSVAVHEVPGAPPMLEVEESIRGNTRVSGIRRVMLGLGKAELPELLAVDIQLDALEQETKRSVLSDVVLTPSGKGLDIEVRRTEKQVVLATGAEKDVAQDVRRYRFEGGKLSPVQSAQATAKPE